jgi:hypothetical protein
MNWCRFVNRGRLVRFTPATILIDLLPGNSRLVLLKTLIGFGIPTQALIPLGLIFRPDLIKHDLTTISFAYIASVWLWLGPLLVWRYERVTLKNFFVGCRYVVADWCAFVRYRKRFRVSLVNNCFDVAVFSI